LAIGSSSRADEQKSALFMIFSYSFSIGATFGRDGTLNFSPSPSPGRWWQLTET
jgi:hypothetical protein